MKSEERHRLHEMEIEKLGRHVKSFWNQYGPMVLVGVAVLAVVAMGAAFWVNRSKSSREAQWQEFFKVDVAGANTADPNVKGYYELADELEGTVVGYWALLKNAERSLAEGMRLSMINRQGSIEELIEARTSFDKLVQNESIPAAVRERALFGQARCLETLAGVDLGDAGDNVETVETVEPAIAAYESFAEEFPDSVLHDVAQQRIAALKTDRVKEFYAWFRKQNPVPPDRDKPQDAIPGSPFPRPAGGAQPSGGNELEDLENFVNQPEIVIEKSPDTPPPNESNDDSTPAKTKSAKKTEP